MPLLIASLDKNLAILLPLPMLQVHLSDMKDTVTVLQHNADEKARSYNN